MDAEAHDITIDGHGPDLRPFQAAIHYGLDGRIRIEGDGWWVVLSLDAETATRIARGLEWYAAAAKGGAP